jgi:hypothetical protein
MTTSAIGTDRAVEVLHDRGPATPAAVDRWTGGSGYLIGSRLVLTAAHNVDYRRDHDDEQLLVRTIEGNLLAARVVLVGDVPSRADLALLEIGDPRFGEQLPPVTFARVDRNSPAPVTECWAVGFPWFGEAGPVLPEGSRRETWQVSGHILPGGKRRAGLLSLQVTANPSAALTGSAWEGMSGAVVFAADAHDGEQAAVGVISTHHRPEGESALTVVPVTTVADLPGPAEWWQWFGVPGPGALPVLPRQRARTGLVRPTPAAGWPLAEVRDPFALEVHRPVRPENSQPGLPELPAYVPRDHDTALGSVVRAAAEGRSGIAVLVGGSSTGKTRACWEALGLLRDCPGPWRLWHPIDPSRPEAALCELPGIGPRTVVWLNEAQLYLDVPADGLGERVGAGLRELLRDPSRAPVLVLATMWPQFLDTLTARPADSADPHAQARELLAGHDITVPPAFTPAQLDQLGATGDARLALAAVAAQDGQVIQFLAGAPELLARYRNAPPPAAALIHAAMDARRLGMGVGLPQGFLAAAAPGYLTDAEWDVLGEDWLEQALAYTAQPSKGVRGPVTRIRPRPARSRVAGPGSPDRAEQRADGPADIPGGPLYRLADYLDQYGRTHRRGQFPLAGFWAATADHASPADQAALGAAAHARGLYRVAAQLHKNAAAFGNLDAVLYLSNPPGCLRGDIGPALWAAAYVPLDHPWDVARLLECLEEAGAPEQATAALLRRDPAAHVPFDDPNGVLWLLECLEEAGAQEQVTALLRRDPAAHVPLDNPVGVANLVRGLRKAGARELATALAGRAAAHVPLDNLFGVVWLLYRLRKRKTGAREQVTVLAGRLAAHAPLDHSHGVAALLRCLHKAGAREQVAALLRRDPAAHADLDAPGSVAWLLDRLRKAGAHEQVTALADRAAAHVPLDDPDAVAKLLDSLRWAGAQEQVTALADRAAAHVPLDDPDAVAKLLDSLRWAGAQEQAAALAGRAAAHVALDNPRGVAGLLGWLQVADAQDQDTALRWPDLAARPSLRHLYAVAKLLDSLEEAGAQEQVTALAGRAAAHAPLDDPRGVAGLLGWLQVADAQDQVTALRWRDPAAHVALDDPGDVAWLLRRLREAGAQEQVTALAGRAAAHVALDDPRGVAWLLDRLREAGAQEQATALAGRAAAHVALDDPRDVAWLLDRLREAGAQEQATALTVRLPGEGMFELFLQQEDRQDRFRFGREADGSPAKPWGWDDLE